MAQELCLLLYLRFSVAWKLVIFADWSMADININRKDRFSPIYPPSNILRSNQETWIKCMTADIFISLLCNFMSFSHVFDSLIL